MRCSDIADDAEFIEAAFRQVYGREANDWRKPQVAGSVGG